MLNYPSVFRTIPGIHNQEYQIEILLFMLLQFLKKLCHKHGIFSTGNTYGNLVPILKHIIGFHSFCKWREQFFMPPFLNTSFNFFFLDRIRIDFLLHSLSQPGIVSTRQTICRNILFSQFLRCINAVFSSCTIDDHSGMLTKLSCILKQILHTQRNRTGNHSVLNAHFIPHINQNISISYFLFYFT